jgi:hypothetical protein
MTHRLRRFLVVALLVVPFAGVADATGVVMPALNRASLVGTWEGIGYYSDTALDQVCLIRLVVGADGKGTMMLGEAFEAEGAGPKVSRFQIRRWSVKKGIVTADGTADGTSDDDYIHAVHLRGRGKGVVGRGRLDVDIDLFGLKNRREGTLSAVLVQDDVVSRFSRLETGLRRFRTEK